MESEQAPKLSRQQRRAQERAAAKGPAPEPKLSAMDLFLEGSSAVANDWRDDHQRFFELSSHIGERFNDPDWRNEAVTEARSWALLLDRVPGDAPKAVSDLQELQLRQFRLAAEVGDAIAACIEAGDVEGTRQALARLREVNAVADAFTQRTRELAAEWNRTGRPR